MSLSVDLERSGSSARRYFEDAFPDRRSVKRRVREKAQETEPIRPARAVPWGTIGTAFDYRCRFYFAAAAVPRGSLPFAGAERPFLGGAHSFALPFELRRLLEFDFKPHVAEVLRHSPPWGVRLGRRHEDVLCRLCYVLALLDAVARTSGPGIWNRLPTDDPPESARTAPAPFDQLPESSSVGDLLDLAGHESVDDLRQLSWLFFDSQQALLTGQAVLNPHFAGSADVGGADADLIVDGCLIELKTVSDAGRISPKAWPWQLLGYVLLDYDNVYELSSVGIYLARHGLLMQWSLEEYFELLGARTCSVAEARVGLRRALSA